jgi:hypothetical protein
MLLLTQHQPDFQWYFHKCLGRLILAQESTAELVIEVNEDTHKHKVPEQLRAESMVAQPL